MFDIYRLPLHVSTLPTRDWNSFFCLWLYFVVWFPHYLPEIETTSFKLNFCGCLRAFPHYLPEIETHQLTSPVSVACVVSTLPTRDWNYKFARKECEIEPFPHYLPEIETVFFMKMPTKFKPFPHYLPEIETKMWCLYWYKRFKVSTLPTRDWNTG